jgi:hypothetical protein
MARAFTDDLASPRCASDALFLSDRRQSIRCERIRTAGPGRDPSGSVGSERPRYPAPSASVVGYLGTIDIQARPIFGRHSCCGCPRYGSANFAPGRSGCSTTLGGTVLRAPTLTLRRTLVHCCLISRSQCHTNARSPRAQRRTVARLPSTDCSRKLVAAIASVSTRCIVEVVAVNRFAQGALAPAPWPIVCQECSKTFAQQSNLRQHQVRCFLASSM